MKIQLLTLFLLFSVIVSAQEEQVPPPVAEPTIVPIRTNRIYGKIADAKTRKGLGSVSLQLYVKTSGSDGADSLIRAKLSEPNGDFEFRDLPMTDSFRLVISSIGYELKDEHFLISQQGMQGRLIDRDLGNIFLEQEALQMEGITITAQRPTMEMGVDRRIFNVDASITATGGTGLDVIRNIPSLTVDAEGNVQLRNSTPQIFVDGRPTILTLDQIPADNIERVEIITNPSAAFDASTTAGILNVILKKNRRMGLNGIASLGWGYPGIRNGSLSLNTRQGKFNIFFSGNMNRSGGIAEGSTLRSNKVNGTITDFFNQYSDNERIRNFTSFRAGLDYFLDNRNTLSLSYGRVNGDFKNNEEQYQEYLNINRNRERWGERFSESNSGFLRNNAQFNYTHRFPEQGKELKGSATYNFGNGNNTSFIRNTFYKNDGSLFADPILVRNSGSNDNNQLTLQIDFTDPKGENGKLETGLRSYINNFESQFAAFSQQNGSEVLLPLSNNISYEEIVNAFYVTWSNKIGENFSYQAGIRAEQSQFSGKMPENGTSFGYKYPKNLNGIFDALFPSLFLTRQMGEKSEMQLNYSRRIRRPNFWQLNPFLDINDPVNIRMGNPLLRPEFTNSMELNYNTKYSKGNILSVLYYRNNQGDITRYSDTITAAQYQQLNNAAVDPNAILNTFINARATNSLGAEFVWQHKFSSNFDITPSVDLQYRKVMADMDHLNLSNEGFNWEAKLITNYKILSESSSFLNNLGFQVIGEYESPEIVPQGRRKEQYSVDLGIRKEFLKDKKATLTFNINDIFWTNRWGAEIDTDRFYQDSFRRNVRTFRLTLSYKFGSANFQIFNRNNDREMNDES